MNSPVLRKEGAHYTHDDLEFWAEDGVICICDGRDGSYNAVTCTEFFKRACAFNEEARVAQHPSDKLYLTQLVMLMRDAYKEAKSQGDPSDPAIMRQKIKERKRAVLVTGMW